ncbi:protein RST1 isoform X2 [Salvia miltiorrhiza]|uniref:protein RST1 isoform X2 n=1 Tax=Salvia miltiorrhiza TaxID=226208 RepID=UPI0025AC892B|nr:protein RST1 isoform X2 [Salvia miltiorrhiza]
MDSYTPLLEKTRIPQPSLQKLAVASIFEKFRSAPPSAVGLDAVSRCLRSTSAAVVDQSTRELCRLVKDEKFDVADGLLELQSALEDASNPQFAAVFTKAIGLLTRLGFERNPSSFRFSSSENHPFVKILSCGTEVQGGLIKEVVVLIMKCKYLGMEAVCEFLGPFLNYSFIQVPISGSCSTYLRNLVSTMAAFCCSSPEEAIPIIKLLTGRLKYISCKNAEEVANTSAIFECLVGAYQVVLRQLVRMGLLIDEAQQCGLELLDSILLLHRDFCKYSGGVEKILDAVRHILTVQKELGLNYCTGQSSVILSLFSILTQVELEHEQYSVLSLALFLLRWKEYRTGACPSELNEELLLIFPVLALVSSPSKSIKQTATYLLSILGRTATNLLIAPREEQAVEGKKLIITTPGHIVFRFIKNICFKDQLSLDGFYYVNRFSDGDVSSNEVHSGLKAWIFSLKGYSSVITAKRKSSLGMSHSEESFLSEMPLILCSVAGVFLMHQTTNFAIDLFTIGSNIEPKLGVPLLLAVLFYNHVCSNAGKYNDFHDKLLKLLALLPSVASHSAMIPLVHQVLLPMLHKDVNPFIKATAIRLICKTWEINDRVFGSLQGMLHPNELVLHGTERGIRMSIAVSIQDVCKRNPDRGVDIILSVAACIENHDPLVQSVGLQSLAYLCEADVIDFYTAWDVVGKQTQNYSENAAVAYGLALFLRWGAMDAEAYPEAAKNVLNILWKIGTQMQVSHSSLWTRGQEAALRALMQYEVVHIQRSIPDFGTKNMGFLFSQTNPDLLAALEEFEVRLINYEHITRRRSVKQKRITGSQNKIFKLLDVVPEVIFGSGSNHRIKKLPGAALLCFPTRKDVRNQESLKGLQDVNSKYEDAALEISGSLLLSRNTLLALLSMQSWKPFMERWLRSSIMVLEAKAYLTMLDKTSKAATDILKILTRLAEAAIPRSSENIALALGAFCLALPASAHAVQSMASKFLLNWLSQYEHEHRQWSAAISLGLISSCLHVTDHEQKFKNITALLEVASYSKSTLVKGACGIGLGFSCQGLLTRVDSGSNTQSDKETYKNQELELLRKIVKTLVQMTDQFSGSSAGILDKLAAYFPLGTDDLSSSKVEALDDNIDHLEEDAWGAAGPVIGLGNSLGAIYRAGYRDAVLYLKSLIISWIPSANDLFPKHAGGGTCLPVLALGACLSVPTVVYFCHKVELIDDTELDHLVSSFMELISGLLSVKQSDNFLQNLLMASCVGAGSFLSLVSSSRLPSLKEEHVKGFLELFRRTYSSTHLPFVQLGGMLGVVNAVGAGAGTLIQQFPSSSSPTVFQQKEPSRVSGSLVSNNVLEAESTSLIQEVFLFAQNSDDPQSQENAAWAVSVLRHSVFSKEDTNDAERDDAGAPKSASQGVAEDTVVMKLSLWLMQINYSMLGTGVNTSMVALVLRCLSHAPRLPVMEWAEISRRCMKYSDRTAEMPSQDIDFRKGTLREECFLFILSHAHQFDSLLGFIDELFDGARFKTLESNLQSLMLLHLADLLKIFSNSRVAKLFDDVSDFLHWFASADQYNNEEKISMRVSCWKSLQICLNESSAIETQDYAHNLERCMEVLFTMLPWSHSSVNTELYRKNTNVEWTEAIRCLGKAQQGWLLKFLLISDTNFKEECNYETLRKVKAKAALVRVGSIPLAELAKLKAYMLDSDSEVIWNILVEVTVTLQHYDVSVRRQWLSDTAEILCVTSYPSTALRFLGLLSGSSSKYMTILFADKGSVLTDLPTTLPPLLAGTGSGMVAESVASCLFRAMERIHDWAGRVGQGHYLPDSQHINSTEEDTAMFLLQVMHQTCFCMKEYLPLDKQVRLANMVVA